MANTVTQTTLIRGGREYINYITIVSDGSEETDLVIYDSSAVATALNITDGKNASIERIDVSTMTTAAGALMKLEFDADTDVLAIPFNLGVDAVAHQLDFSRFGGLKNYAGTGKTGDVTLTTLGLTSGDAIMIVLSMRI